MDEFEGQTNSLVYDIFISKPHSKAVEERLCAEPKSTPEKALHFSVAFQEGLRRQTSYGERKLDVESESISVCVITNIGKVCFRCGAHNFIFPDARHRKKWKM